ncbi:hypothetical protein KSP39_PZI001388 [Platanthera zijinensis]|uniref:Uncharacterized protein n=1 Tax=Platanthera zijinensis TaxID=2320716 RepID=A0AAP0C226_9ASPA
MSACCRSSPDLTLPHADLRRQLRRRPIDGLSSASIRLRPPAVGTVGRLFVVEAVLPRGSRCKWAMSSRVRDRVISAARLNAVGERIGDLERDVIPVLAAEAEEGRRRSEVVVAAAMTAVLGTGNRVLYKLALVPLKQYPFFLAQLATIGYVIVYFSILYGRYRAGIVTNEMLSMPKTPFMAVGLLEALGAASGMAAGAVLSGAWIPILSQTFLVWQLVLSFLFLGKRYPCQPSTRMHSCFSWRSNNCS